MQPSHETDGRDMPTIYVRLLNEGTDVWCPVEAVHLRGNQYLIASVIGNPEHEVWQLCSL
jgi:hypothetical protein